MFRIPVCILLIVALLNLLVGCGDERKDPVAVGNDAQGARDNSVPVSQLEPMSAPSSDCLFQKQVLDGELRILSYSQDQVQNLISIDLEFTDRLGVVLNRRIELSPMASPILETGLCSKLLDDNGNLMWLTEVELDTTAPLRLKYVEATQLDRMEIMVADQGDTISESYVFGDEQIAFAYLPEEIEYLKTLIQTPEQVCAKPTSGSDERIVALYNNAMQLHNRSLAEVPTLYDNSEGELLLSVVTDTDFIEWLGEEINPGMEPTSLTIERLCAINAAFGTVKCIMLAALAPENPLCYISGGIGLACTGYLLLSWLF
jgi:hypothetical protein